MGTAVDTTGRLAKKWGLWTTANRTDLMIITEINPLVDMAWLVLVKSLTVSIDG